MSTYFDAEAARQQYREYDSERLMRIALAGIDEYAEEAIDLARQELVSRGMQDARFDRPPGRSPPPIPGVAARNALPVWMKILCVVMPGIAIFVGAGYMMAGKKDAGGEALFLMVAGWFLWFVAFNLLVR
jgi:hypothetical protein